MAPSATSSVLAPSSLVAMPGAPSSVLVPSRDSEISPLSFTSSPLIFSEEFVPECVLVSVFHDAKFGHSTKDQR